MKGHLEIKEQDVPEYNPNPKNDIYKPYGSAGSDSGLLVGVILGVICIVTSFIVIYNKILFVLGWVSGILMILKFGGMLYCKYAQRKRTIKNGRAYAGVITQVYDYTRSVTNGGTAIDYVEYAMEVHYGDKIVELKGNEVDARKYLENPYCTVYEWKNSVIAADFKVRDEYISKNGKAYSIKPRKVKR